MIEPKPSDAASSAYAAPSTSVPNSQSGRLTRASSRPGRSDSSGGASDAARCWRTEASAYANPAETARTIAIAVSDTVPQEVVGTARASPAPSMPCSPTGPTVRSRVGELVREASAARRARSATSRGTTRSRSRGAARCPHSTYRRRTSATTVSRRRLFAPVATPRGPQHGLQPGSSRAAQRRVREDPERRAEPPRRGAGQLGERVAAAPDVVGGRAGCAAQHVPVHVAVHRDLVPGRRDLADEPGRAPRHRAEHEERGAPAEAVEHGEERRASTRDRGRRRTSARRDRARRGRRCAA